ncbi:sialate O-acetylesterase [soil metagenome]
MNRLLNQIFALAIGTLIAPSSWAKVTLPPIFSDHAVLQKFEKVPVWGKADPGEKITVTLDKVTAQAVAGPDGKWKTVLDLRASGPGPFELHVKGANELVAKDVVVGEVWACTGQSNMAFPLAAFPQGKEEIPISENLMLRQFQVANTPSPVPLEEAEGKWTVANPLNSGAFSAVGYFFGKKIQKALGVPVGLINDCVGGTVIESWMSEAALNADPELKAGKDKAQTDRKAFDEYGALYTAWQEKYGRLDHPETDVSAYTAPDIDTGDWKTVNLPGLFGSQGFPRAGAIWIRKKIPVPSPPDIAADRGIDLFLGDIRDSNSVYWSGKKIGESGTLAVERRYGVRYNLVVPDFGVLAVRIFNGSEGIGILPSKARFQGNHFMFAGEWQAKVEFALPPLTEAEKRDLPIRPALPIEPQNVASYLFNGMINPIIPYAIKGWIWYQGEGNWTRGAQYRTAFPLMIADWRAKWGQGDLPFYFCQIASFGAHTDKPSESPFADVRDSQNATLAVPNTGQAILIDIGEEGNIHPADKDSVGDRLSRIALAKTYGKDLIFSGPVYDSMAIDGSKVRVKFKNVEKGLVAKPMPATYKPVSTDSKELPLVRNSPKGTLEGFVICGDDHKWKWATANIDGDTVVLESEEVPKPVAVRYAWAQYPFCNLYNSAGLPAGPFRTDDFPLPSAKVHY